MWTFLTMNESSESSNDIKDDNLWQSLGCPVFVVAPMVDQSELPFRLLTRKYGATLCYTPMLSAGIFVKDPKYRKENFVITDQDRPLIVQFCANDPQIFLQAATIVAPFCDAVDLNLGCPQTIAKRGRYGAFLSEEWDLLDKMIRTVTSTLSIPITCKIRMFDQIEKTIKYSQMLENAGCKLLTIHARTKEQKGTLTGLANWEVIKAIKKNVNIPVFANGNIQSLSDVYKCLQETGVDGVMSAEGILHNPALFMGIHPHTCIIAKEYLDLVDEYPCSLAMVRGHLFKMFHISLTIEENYDLRELLAKGNTMNHFRNFLTKITERYPYKSSESFLMSSLPVSPYLCQPYFRPLPGAIKCTNDSKKRKGDEQEVEQLSNRIKRKLKAGKLKLENLGQKQSRKLPLCLLCPNPKGMKCNYQLCKACCKRKTMEQILDCSAHRFLFHSKASKKKLSP